MQAQNGTAGWGQPTIPEGVPQTLVAPAAPQLPAWGSISATEAYTGDGAPAEVPAGQDLYTSYADLQPQTQWLEPPAPAVMPGYAAPGDSRTQWQPQSYAQDDGLTEVQL